MSDYRNRKVRFIAKSKVTIEYDRFLKETFYGSPIQIVEEINNKMDRYGFRVAEAVDDFTGEILIYVTTEEQEEE